MVNKLIRLATIVIVVFFQCYLALIIPNGQAFAEVNTNGVDRVYVAVPKEGAEPNPGGYYSADQLYIEERIVTYPNDIPRSMALGIDGGGYVVKNVLEFQPVTSDTGSREVMWETTDKQTRVVRTTAGNAGNYTMHYTLTSPDAPEGQIIDQWFVDENGLSAQDGGTVSQPAPFAGGINQTEEEAALGQSGYEDTLSSQCYGWGIGWVICPILNILARFGDFLIQAMIVPFLQTSPIKISDANDNIFKVWSSFRIVANIILVAALLFVIFGNAFGDGFAQAYLAKKSLPRIFIAAILINTSIYIAAGMIDITNVIGKGIGQMMMAPFVTNGTTLLFNLGTSAGLFTLSMIGGAIWVTWAAASGVIPFILLFVILPAVIAMIAVFFTLVLRQGILLLLVLISPVAFALYALPNTAKYFGKWWDTFLKTLLVYPIVMIIIALSNILSVLINGIEQNNSNEAIGMITDLISIFLMLAPLFIIPFAFKMAGGITAQIADTTSALGKRGVEAYKGDPRDPNSRRNRVRKYAGSEIIRARADAIGRLDPATTHKNLFVRASANTASTLLNIGNIQKRRSDFNQRSDKIVKDMIASGHEDTVRALFASKWEGPDEAGPNGRKHGRYYSKGTGPSGKYKEYSFADVTDARAIVKNDQSLFQAFGKYEFSKAHADNAIPAFREAFAEQANRIGYTKAEAGGVWTGIKYTHKGARLEEKHRGMTGEKGSLGFGAIDNKSFSEELSDVVRNWDYSNFRSGTGIAAADGLRTSLNNRASGRGTVDDDKIIRNFGEVAENMETMLQMGAIGSVRADSAWRDFYDVWADSVGKPRIGRITQPQAPPPTPPTSNGPATSPPTRP